MAGLPDTLWVEPASGTFDVFDVDGQLLGHVAFPGAVGYSPLLGRPDPVVRGDTVWVLVPSERGDGNDLARFLVVWPGAGR
jgi:hypothetical protein